jgi:hypothetical protein
MEKHRKCKLCGDNANWGLDGDCYCEFCLRTELGVVGVYSPRECKQCGVSLDRIYYLDGEGYTFCSAKCAFEYHDAKKLDEEEQDDESGN